MLRWAPSQELPVVTRRSCIIASLHHWAERLTPTWALPAARLPVPQGKEPLLYLTVLLLSLQFHTALRFLWKVGSHHQPHEALAGMQRRQARHFTCSGSGCALEC